MPNNSTLIGKLQKILRPVSNAITYYKKNNFFFVGLKNYLKTKKLYNSKLKRFPLLITIIDKTSHPFNGCKRVKRY
jgi:hypothetical protein